MSSREEFEGKFKRVFEGIEFGRFVCIEVLYWDTEEHFTRIPTRVRSIERVKS